LPAVPDPAVHQHDDVETLRSRIAELERELADRTERAAAAVAAAEDRAYWLDRWRIDLNAVMEHRLAQHAFAVTRAAYRLKRAAGVARRHLDR
jgi:hypothetical protein